MGKKKVTNVDFNAIKIGRTRNGNCSETSVCISSSNFYLILLILETSSTVYLFPVISSNLPTVTITVTTANYYK